MTIDEGATREGAAHEPPPHGSPPYHIHRVRVAPNDIDALSHANNASYLRWIQEVAEGHWRVLTAAAPAGLTEALVWMVRRHEIDYFRQTFVNDELEVITWVPACSDTTCDRATVIRRGDQVVARALSTYCVLHAATGRLQRVSEELKALFGNPARSARPRKDADFPPLPDGVR